MCGFVCVNAKHLEAAQCSNTEYGIVGKDDGLILKQFTEASLIGCGISPSHSDIQVPGGEGGVGSGGGSLTIEFPEIISYHCFAPSSPRTLAALYTI